MGCTIKQRFEVLRHQSSLNLFHPTPPLPYINCKSRYTCCISVRLLLQKTNTEALAILTLSWGICRNVSWHLSKFSLSAKVKYCKCGSVALSLSTLAGPRKTMCINRLQYHAVIRKRIRRSTSLFSALFEFPRFAKREQTTLPWYYILICLSNIRNNIKYCSFNNDFIKQYNGHTRVSDRGKMRRALTRASGLYSASRSFLWPTTSHWWFRTCTILCLGKLTESFPDLDWLWGHIGRARKGRFSGTRVRFSMGACPKRAVFRHGCSLYFVPVDTKV